MRDKCFKTWQWHVPYGLRGIAYRYAHSPGFESQPIGKLSARWFINVCAIPQVDVKDPTVSFMKSRRAIAGTMNKLQIPELTYRGHCSNGPATPEANDAILQPWATYERSIIQLFIVCWTKIELSQWTNQGVLVWISRDVHEQYSLLFAAIYVFYTQWNGVVETEKENKTIRKKLLGVERCSWKIWGISGEWRKWWKGIEDTASNPICCDGLEGFWVWFLTRL